MASAASGLCQSDPKSGRIGQTAAHSIVVTAGHTLSCPDHPTFDETKMQPIRTRYGEIFVPDHEEDLAGQFLRYYGEIDWLETSFIATLLPALVRVLDVGASIGTFSLGIAAAGKLEFACSVEANAENFAFLTRNAALSSANIHALHASVGDFDPGAGMDGDAENNVAGLSELIDRHGPFDLIRINGGGTEVNIMRSFDWSRHPNTLLWLECNESERTFDLIDLLFSAGQQCWYFAWPAHNPDNFAAQSDDLMSVSYGSALLVGKTTMELPEAFAAAGCILSKINVPNDLREALWQTPRTAAVEWRALDHTRMIGVASHLISGQRQDSFMSYARLKQDLELERKKSSLLQDALAAQAQAHLSSLSTMGAELEQRLMSHYDAEIANRETLIDSLNAQLAGRGKIGAPAIPLASSWPIRLLSKARRVLGGRRSTK